MRFNLPKFKLLTSPMVKTNVYHLADSALGLAQITNLINISLWNVSLLELTGFAPEAIEVRAVKLPTCTSAIRLSAADELSADGSRQNLR
jgi:hypothetical protein